MTDIWETDVKRQLWDRPYTRNRRLSTQPEAISALIAAFESAPQTSGRLIGLRHDPPPEPFTRLMLSATWAPTRIPVLVKLNVDPWEGHWMPALSESVPDLVPKVLAAGERIGPYEVAWLVLERVPHLLSHKWGDRMYDLLAAAAVRFHQAARTIDQRFVGLVCIHSTAASLKRGLGAGCPGPVQRVLDRLEDDWAWVNSHCGLEVCCGDLTMGNSLSRTPPSAAGPILLIDPIPRVAPWAWDGAFCQTLDANADVRLIQRMALERQRRGLPVPDPPVLEQVAAMMLAWLGIHRWWSVPFRQEDPEWRLQIQRYIEAAACLTLRIT